MPEMTTYNTRAEAARRLAESIADRLRQAISERGQASLVVCGGSSPRELFEYLADQSLEWSAVTIIPSDERWVKSDDEQSNERLIRSTLLSGQARQARFVGLYRDTETPQQALATVSEVLDSVDRPLDVVLLGMGNDGHTASLFPQAPDIETCLASNEPCVAPDVDKPARISLSLAFLSQARSIDVLVFGENKKQVLARADYPGDVADLPIRGILNLEQPTAQIHWAE